MRLEFETARLAMISTERLTVPRDFEFSHESATIVCPFTEGTTLADRFRTGSLDANETLSVAEDLLEALAVLHRNGMTRRCLLPNEVYLQNVDGRLRAVLVGFGPRLLLQEHMVADVAREIATYSSPEA
jgi:serine/threonine protein kinase